MSSVFQVKDKFESTLIFISFHVELYLQRCSSDVGLERISLLFPDTLFLMIVDKNINRRGSTRGSHLHIYVSSFCKVENKDQNAEMIVVSESEGHKNSYVKSNCCSSKFWTNGHHFTLPS